MRAVNASDCFWWMAGVIRIMSLCPRHFKLEGETGGLCLWGEPGFWRTRPFDLEEALMVVWTLPSNLKGHVLLVNCSKSKAQTGSQTPYWVSYWCSCSDSRLACSYCTINLFFYLTVQLFKVVRPITVEKIQFCGLIKETLKVTPNQKFKGFVKLQPLCLSVDGGITDLQMNKLTFAPGHHPSWPL